MDQIKKFYLSSFLKNQTYFVPILVVFLQAQHLSLQQVFWVFSIGSVVSFLLEIPTGIFADFYGKKKSIVLAKILVTSSFLLFAFAQSFLLFVLAQVIYEAGQAFRSGTEAAYIYDYLDQEQGAPGYTEVKGKQKFWARAGEALATALGGVIAAKVSYAAVFLVAAVPAAANIFNVLSWTHIREREEKRFLWPETKRHVKHAFMVLGRDKKIRTIMLNFSIFTASLAAIATFTQPYMTQANIPIEYFGFIYAASLAVSAFAVRYSYKVEAWFGRVRTTNALTFFAVLPALVLGLGYKALIGVGFFFLLTIIENIRSPILNTLFHDRVRSAERSTMGSLLEQSKSLAKMILLPIIGFFAKAYSMEVAILIIAGLLLINAFSLRLRGLALTMRASLLCAVWLPFL